MTEGGLPCTVSICSVVHFERLAPTADWRVTICEEMGLHACHVTQRTINTSECAINTNCSIAGECGACVHVPHKHSSRDTACKEVTCLNHSMHV